MSSNNIDRKYPRPKILCNDCGSYKILCWGIKRKLYLRHMKNENCTNNSFGMSEEHQFAQDLLTDYLNIGKPIIFQKKCYCCRNITLPFDVNVYIKEYTHKINNEICRYDITGLNNDMPLFGIEIYYTHRANNSSVRNNLPWVELNALEVISKLDVNQYNNVIILEDISCENKKNTSTMMISSLNALSNIEKDMFMSTISHL